MTKEPSTAEENDCLVAPPSDEYCRCEEKENEGFLLAALSSKGADFGASCNALFWIGSIVVETNHKSSSCAAASMSAYLLPAFHADFPAGTYSVLGDWPL